MNQNLFSSMNKDTTRCNNNEIDKFDIIKSKCNNINYNPCYRYCYVIGPTGSTGPSGGPTGATGPQGI